MAISEPPPDADERFRRLHELLRRYPPGSTAARLEAICEALETDVQAGFHELRAEHRRIVDQINAMGLPAEIRTQQLEAAGSRLKDGENALRALLEDLVEDIEKRLG